MKLALGTFVCALLLVGCGSAKSHSTTPAAAPPATAAAQGDIPDNQMFLVLTNAKAGYSMKYPEGWAQNGKGDDVTIRDKNNIVRVKIQSAALPSFAQIKNDLKGTTATSSPTRVTVGGKPAIKVSYSTQSAPNPVTGKRVTLVTDRYYLSQGPKEAIIDLGTPRGVDNVDAYRLMIESFRWE